MLLNGVKWCKMAIPNKGYSASVSPRVSDIDAGLSKLMRRMPNVYGYLRELNRRQEQDDSSC